MICTRCVLPDTFPGLTFNADGVCSLCAAEPSGEEAAAHRKKLRDGLENIYRTVRGNGDYDALVAYSGGKDSSYTLCTLVEKFKLRCLAITVDNGFVSEQAIVNCKTITDALGVDHILYKPSFDFMKKMYGESLKGGLHVGAAVKRASAICNSCINLINNHMVKTALQLDIPIIAGGYLGGQVPKDAVVFELKPHAMKVAREAALKRVEERFGKEEAGKFFGLRDVGGDVNSSVMVTNPMLVLEADEATIFSTLNKMGWKRPADTGRHSSNCRLNDLGIHVHLAQHNFHPYVAELAEQVRSGLMKRDEAIERLAARPTVDQLAPIAAKLGIERGALPILP